MTDNEICDKLVGRGVLRKVEGDEGTFYNLEIMDPLETAYTIIRNWHVAGKCLERMPLAAVPELWKIITDGPRAICEAFVSQ